MIWRRRHRKYLLHGAVLYPISSGRGMGRRGGERVDEKKEPAPGLPGRNDDAPCACGTAPVMPAPRMSAAPAFECASNACMAAGQVHSVPSAPVLGQAPQTSQNPGDLQFSAPAGRVRIIANMHIEYGSNGSRPHSLPAATRSSLSRTANLRAAASGHSPRRSPLALRPAAIGSIARKQPFPAARGRVRIIKNLHIECGSNGPRPRSGRSLVCAVKPARVGAGVEAAG